MSLYHYHAQSLPNGNSDILNLARLRLKEISLSYIVTNRLKELNISENLLEEIPVELIEATPLLSIADFSFNQISRLPDEINKWRQLTILKLDRNNLVQLPSTITQLLELELLSISSNLLEDLPNFSAMPSMKSLSIIHNPKLPAFLIKIYAYIYPFNDQPSSTSNTQRYNQLQLQLHNQHYQHHQHQLQLQHQANLMNSTTTVIVQSGGSSNDDHNNGSTPPVNNNALSPGSRLPTSKLPAQHITINVSPMISPRGSENGGTPNCNNSKENRLNLESSGFTHFPFAVESTKLSKLPRLLLGKNYRIDFERCHYIWATFRGLKVLSLDHCQLNIFPIGLCNIPSLRRINLKKNYIQLIPGEIKKLVKLKRIDLSHNQLEFIPNEIEQLKLLKSININSNRISKLIAVEPLSRVESLEKISLNHNLLTEFPQFFQQLQKLHTLYLEFNRIEHLPPDIEKSWPSLRDFSIANNRMPTPRSARQQHEIQKLQNSLPLSAISPPLIPASIPPPPPQQIQQQQQQQSQELQLNSMMEQLCLSPHSSSNEPMSPNSTNTPLSPSVNRRPPKPLPIPPSSSMASSNIAMKTRSSTIASASPIPTSTTTTTTVLQSPTTTTTTTSNSTKPKVPLLKLNKNSNNNLSQSTVLPSNSNNLVVEDEKGYSYMSSSVSNDQLSKMASGGNGGLGMSSIGLGARVRSYTSYEYSGSSNDLDEKQHQLIHTASTSSCGSWLDDEANHQELVSPPGLDQHQKSGKSVFTSPRGGKEKRLSKLTEIFAFAKETISFRKKNNSSNNQINNINTTTGGNNAPKSKSSDSLLTPRSSNILNNPSNNAHHCISSPSTPRPSFPERNGSNNSIEKLGKENNPTASSESSPTPRKRERKITSSVSNGNLSYYKTNENQNGGSGSNSSSTNSSSNALKQSTSSTNINSLSQSVAIPPPPSTLPNLPPPPLLHTSSNSLLMESMDPNTYEETVRNMNYSSSVVGIHNSHLDSLTMVSQSMPVTSSILMDTSNRDDNLSEINRSTSISSSSASIFRKSPPDQHQNHTHSNSHHHSTSSISQQAHHQHTSSNVSSTSTHSSNSHSLTPQQQQQLQQQQQQLMSQKWEYFKQMKIDYVEEIYFEDTKTLGSYLNTKKKLGDLFLTTSNKQQHSQSNGIGLLVPSTSLPSRKSISSVVDPSKKKLKKKDGEGGGLRESTSTGNLTSNTNFFLDGDDFIRDLMASPVINSDVEFTSEDGVPKIKSATLKMLLSVLTHEKGQSKELEHTFFDTYRLFTNFEIILPILNDRFYHTGKNNSPIIKQRVLRFVQHWVDRNWQDFNEIQSNGLLDFCKSCQETVEQGMPTSTYSIKNQITSLNNVIKMRRDGTYVADEEEETWEQPPIPDFVFQENFTLLDLKAHEIARQLSIIDQSLLSKISKNELLQWIQNQQSAPASINAVTNRFNRVSRWVSYEIVTCKNLEKRIQLIFKFVNIAMNCWILKNFNSAVSIMAGMKHGSVLRLKTTWYIINNSKAAPIIQEFDDLLSQASMVKLRKYMDTVEAPAVPYLGNYFNHMVSIAEGNKSTKEDHINVLKYEMLGKILQRVHLFASKPYNLASVGVIQKFLNDIPMNIDENQLYETATKMESSNDLSENILKMKKKRKSTLDG